MSKPKLYVMCGVSGSGKTTFAKKFAAEHALYYLCPDDFYQLFNGDERKHYNEFEVWMALYRALHLAEQQGVDTIFDTNNPTLAGRVQLLEWFPDFQHHLLYIEASPELCRKNNTSRRRVIPVEEMERMLACFQPPSLDEDDRWDSVTVMRNVENDHIEVVETRRRDAGE